MKLVYVLPLLLVGLLPVAFGEITTDKQEYHYGDTVVVSGTAELEDRELLEIYLTDSNGVRGLTDISTDIEFEEGIFIHDHDDLSPPDFHYKDKDFFSQFGEYTIHVVSIKSDLVDGERVYKQTPTYHEMTTFVLTESGPLCEDGFYENDGICYRIEETRTEAPQDDPKDLKILELEKRIETLENEKSLLEKTNDGLQEQVNNLQVQLENANAIMQEQLKVIVNTLSNLKLG